MFLHYLGATDPRTTRVEPPLGPVFRLPSPFVVPVAHFRLILFGVPTQVYISTPFFTHTFPSYTTPSGQQSTGTFFGTKKPTFSPYQ